MNRSQLILDLNQYFSIEELVCEHVYKRFGERAWMFFSDSYLQTLLVVRRDILKAARGWGGRSSAGTGTNSIASYFRSRLLIYLLLCLFLASFGNGWAVLYLCTIS